jgi:hypothetical protein
VEELLRAVKAVEVLSARDAVSCASAALSKLWNNITPPKSTMNFPALAGTIFSAPRPLEDNMTRRTLHVPFPIVALFAATFSLLTDAQIGPGVGEPAMKIESVAPDRAGGAVPRFIQFSGQINESKNLLLHGAVPIEFSIYTQREAGSPLWTEIQNVQPDEQGRYTAMLGMTKNEGISPEVLGTGELRWLSIRIAGTEEQPRMLMVSVPYALMAEEAFRLGGSPASDFVRKQDLHDALGRTLDSARVDEARTKPQTAASVGSPASTSPPTTFSGNTTTQIVLVTQVGTGIALAATAPSGGAISGTGGAFGIFGKATSSNGIGVKGVASATPNAATVGVSGLSQSGNGIGVTGNGGATGVYGVSRSSASALGGPSAGVKGESTDITDTSGRDFGVWGISHSPTGAGVSGTNVSSTGVGYGVVGSTKSSSNGASGVFGSESSTTGQVFGVEGSTNSTGNFSAGVAGFAGATTGQVFGVRGATASSTTSSAGIWGNATATTGAVFGVVGGTASSTDSSAGVQGYATAGSGQVFGVTGGSASSTNGASGVSGNNSATTGLVYGVRGVTSSDGQFASGVNGFEGSTTGQVFGVSGGTNSTGNGSSAVSGFEGAIAGQVYGVSGGTNSAGAGSAAVSGFEGAIAGQVYGVSGGTNSAGAGSAAVNGFEGATMGRVYGINGGTNSAGNGSAAVNGFEGAATGTVYGVSGGTSSSGEGSAGVAGVANSTTGSVYGVTGTTNSTSNFSAGVSGFATAKTGQVLGVQGAAASSTTSSAGVWGNATSTTGAVFGVIGSTQSSTPSSAGVQGYASATTGGAYGVVGGSVSPGGVGIVGTNPAGGLAGRFDGNVRVNGNLQVTGTVSKGGGSFKIDHPLDPANKYLYHSFVESPDMKDIYDGIATLDAQGEATLVLPDWFEALNQDFRYQLTSIGVYAPLYVADEIKSNRFRIAGGRAGMRVSWQVTGIRKDAFANAHRTPVEEDKLGSERGHYLEPTLFRRPEELRIGAVPGE